MRGNRSLARGVAAWLGLGLLGVTGSAWGQSDPCRCSVLNPSVVSEHPCLVINTGACGNSRVTNTCAEAVTLVEWPLQACEPPLRYCSRELRPGESAAFDFLGQEPEGDVFVEEDEYVVEVHGQGRPLTATADESRPPAPPREEAGGCAVGPGALAALGVLLWAGPVARGRRGGGGLPRPSGG